MLLIYDRIDPSMNWMVGLGLVSVVLMLIVITCSYRLVWGKWPLAAENRVSLRNEQDKTKRHFLLSVVYFFLMVTVCLVLMNLAASFFAVPWPLNGLHGVSPRVGKIAWKNFEKVRGFVPVNSWGQRDNERARIPAPDIYRIVFVGDSFLEEGAPIPLPLRTEEKLKATGMTNAEIINLGVSGTNPDEYYFRIKNIGLPLLPLKCVVFLYAGNDFIQKSNLFSVGGIVATYPQDSLLYILGLRSLNHVISNEKRQFLQTWFKGEGLLEKEKKLSEDFRNSQNDAETEEALLSFLSPNQQKQLKKSLHKAGQIDLHRFCDMLRHPDDGRFRSYYLMTAMAYALGWPAPQFISDEYTFRWVKAAFELCHHRDVDFTIVIIPDAFSVDSRMIEQWQPLANMKDYVRYTDDASNRFIIRAKDEGIDVVDLRDLLKINPGSYLNMDGHWSQHGVDVVAEFLAQRIRKQIKTSVEK